MGGVGDMEDDGNIYYKDRERSVGRLVVDGRTTSTRTSAKDEGRPQRASMSRGNIFLWSVNNPFPRPFPSQPAEQGARDGH